MTHAAYPCRPPSRDPRPGRASLPWLLAAFFLGAALTGVVMSFFRPTLPRARPSAGPVPETLPPAPLPDLPLAPEVFRANTEEVSLAAATLAGLAAPPTGPLAVSGGIKVGDAQRLWHLLETEMALPLRPGPLKGVVDGQPLAMLPNFRARGGEGQTPDLAHFNDVEAEAFAEALLKANLTSAGAFANSARRDLTFADLYNEPAQHRGEVVHFEGALRRVRKSDPPGMAKGVRAMYEGWVFDTRYGPNPVCLVFTDLPPGVPVAERMNVPVTFDAYFFKKYRYQAADTKPGFAREAPLFIGRAPVVQGPEETADGPPPGFSPAMLTGFLVLLLATAVLAFLLHLWFRRNDRHVRRRLEAVRPREFVDPSEPPPGPWPPGPASRADIPPSPN